MTKKINVAFIYKPSYKFLTGNHFDNTTYYFFMLALKRNSRINISYFPEEKLFDTSKLKNKFDIILIPENYSEATPELIGIENLSIPVISRVGDPHDAKRKNKFIFHKKFKINYYFNFMDESYFYKYYPKNYNYKTIIFGLESSLYENVKPYNQRIKNKILNSGAIGKQTIKSRVANKIINPKRSSWYFYKLRTLCNKLKYVEHARDVEKNYKKKDYQHILSQYCASIGATTFYPTIKYWEISASGCLTFMEITKENHGEYLGYKDNETAIFINEKNYKKKFEEYLNDIDNPKWEKIAQKGRNYTMNYLNNDRSVDSLVDLFNEVI